MHWVVCAAALAAAPVDAEAVLLDFYADWCGPCRAMNPVVHRLAQEGYPVRKVNIDREPELARRYGVRQIPCFVMLVRGRVVDRQVGATSRGRLLQMLAKARSLLRRDLRQRNNPSPGNSPPADPFRKRATGQATAPPQSFPAQQGSSLARWNPGTGSARQQAQLESLLLAASVRIKVNDPSGYSFGSGTIIDARNGKALVLTCGHLFRDSRGKGPVVVDLFGPGAPQGLPAQLIGYDLKRDLGLLVVRPGVSVVAAPVAPPGYRVRVGDPVVTIGCDQGRPPTLWRSRVTSLDRFAGPPNLQAAGQPVIGRSGGGLFSREGYLVGVCNAAIPSDNQGLYAALGSIYQELDRHRLSFVFRRPQNTLQVMLAQGATRSPPVPKQTPPRPSAPTDEPPWQPSGVRSRLGGEIAALVGQRDSEHRVPQLSLGQLRHLLENSRAVYVVPVDGSGTGQVFRLDRRSGEQLARWVPEEPAPQVNWTFQRVPQRRSSSSLPAQASPQGDAPSGFGAVGQGLQPKEPPARAALPWRPPKRSRR